MSGYRQKNGDKDGASQHGADEKPLFVQFMGTFSVRYGGNALRLARSYTGKAMQLLVALLYNGAAGVSRQMLMDRLYPESGADAANCLKALLFRLRQKLAGCGLPGSLHIEYEAGRYRFTDRIPVESDVSAFERAVQEAGHARGKRRIRLLQAACGAYGGELLPQLGMQPWIEWENARLHGMFDDMARQLTALYHRQGTFDAAYMLSRSVLTAQPFDERWILSCIESLLLKGAYQQAFSEYLAAAQRFTDKLGAQAAGRLASGVRDMVERFAGPPVTADDTDILGALNETRREHGGAYACSYPGFVDSYRVLRRIMLREKTGACLLMCTVLDCQGNLPERSGRSDILMQALHRALSQTLGPGDLFTRCGTMQMLALLWDTAMAQAYARAEEIQKAFTENCQGLNPIFRLDCAVSPADI